MPELPPPPNPLQHTMASLVPALLSSPVSISLGCIWVLISLVALTLPLRAKRRTGESAATPPRSVSPPPREKIPALELPLRRVPPAGKTSITALFSGLFPTRAVPAAPNKDAPVPVTNRTREEILSYGHFPDYVALSGVPLPKPCPEFDINRAIPRPYRPFRWAYHQTMSFNKMEPDWWLELESTYPCRIAQRIALFAKHGTDVLQSLPGSESATNELMEMALQFLVARYPHYFVLENRKGKEVFVNRILGREFVIREMDPLRVLLENVPEDFAITLRNSETGVYECRAGVVCSSLGWNLQSKMGLTLDEIHAPVPDYKEKMSMSMNRYFSKMPTSTPIQRGSWGLEYLEPLYMPPKDSHEVFRAQQSPTLELKDINLRVDWQTLRRLPLSGAIVFNFKALFTPLSEVADEPGVPAVLVEVMKRGKRCLMKYKNTWHVEHVALPALEAMKAQQIGDGVVAEDWEVGTLDEYPLFEGWEAKWRRQQGF